MTIAHEYFPIVFKTAVIIVVSQVSVASTGKIRASGIDAAI
jgi:hypothetical protein